MNALDVASALGQTLTSRTVRSDLLALVELGLLEPQGQGPSTTCVATKAPFCADETASKYFQIAARFGVSSDVITEERSRRTV
jgi:hypothetical protein